MRRLLKICTLLLARVFLGTGCAEEPEHTLLSPLPAGVAGLEGIEFARPGGVPLRLDLYRPIQAASAPRLVIWLHGGGWHGGSRAGVNTNIIRLVKDGYTVASVDYRLEGLGCHPKQIHDVKGAVRWLRAHAEEYGYDASRVGVGGISAGGHLAMLLGLSGDVPELEGNIGGNAAESSGVQAIVSIHGPSDLDLFAGQNPDYTRRIPPEKLRSASPARYLSADDPPLLLFHGDRDTEVPLAQSMTIHELYQALGLLSSVHVVDGADHDFQAFDDPALYPELKRFFDRHLLERDND